MKTIITLVTFFSFFTFYANAQNVGIKTIPAERFHVDSGNIKIGKSLWTSASDNLYLMFGDGNFVTIGEASVDDQLNLNAKNFIFMPSVTGSYPGNVGIGNTSPTEKLDITGNMKVSNTATINTLKITGTGGNEYDQLRLGTGGEVKAKKGYNAVGINYIISLCGIYPSQGSPCGTYGDAILGEIRMFAGLFAPSGWAFCTGQLLPVTGNDAIFSLLGTTYGGNGTTNFALPDLRASVPVHPGTNGNTWQIGERN